MEDFEIISYVTYRDGGSIEFNTNQGYFWIDRRMGTSTPGKVYKGQKNNIEFIPEELESIISNAYANKRGADLIKKWKPVLENQFRNNGSPLTGPIALEAQEKWLLPQDYIHPNKILKTALLLESQECWKKPSVIEDKDKHDTCQQNK